MSSVRTRARGWTCATGWTRACLALAALVVTCGAVLAVAALSDSPLHLGTLMQDLASGNATGLRRQLAGLGGTAVAALVILCLVHTILPFPAELLTAAAGFALGVPAALAVLVPSLLASAVVAYLIGERLGYPAAMRLGGQARVERATRRVERAGAPALLAVRLCPLVPFSPVGLACGVARVPPRRYLWTTALGILPEMTLVALLGSQLRVPTLSDPRLWAPLAGILGLVILGSVLVRATGPRRSTES